MSATTLPTVSPEARKIVAVAADVRDIANDITVASKEDADFAMSMAGEWKAHLKPIEAERKKVLSQVKAIADHLKGMYDPAIDALTYAAKTVTAKVGSWQLEQQRLAQLEETRAREAAEAERRRIEQQRAAEEAEARRRADEAMKAAEEAFAKGDEEQGEALVQQSAAAEQTAMATRDVSIMEQTAVVESVAAIKAEKVGGLTLRKTWSPEPVDGDEQKALAMLVAAAAEDPSLLAYLQIDMVAVRKECTAKAAKGFFNIPGFTAKENTTAVNRA